MKKLLSTGSALALALATPSAFAASPSPLSMQIDRTANGGQGPFPICANPLSSLTGVCNPIGTMSLGGVFTPNIPANSIGQGLLGSIEKTGAGSARSVPDMLGDAGFNPLDFGAKCDGMTVDTAALQALVNASGALGIHVSLAPVGRTCVSDQLLTVNNLFATIDGTLKLKDGSNQNLIASNGGNTNVVIGGNGTLDCNQANQNPTARPSCIYSYGPSKNWVVGPGMGRLKIINAKYFPWNIVGGTTATFATEASWPGAAHIVVQNVDAIGGGNSNEFASGCYDCVARNVTSTKNLDYGFAAYGGCFKCEFGPFRSDYGAGGIVVLSDGTAGGPTSTPSNDVFIHDATAAYNAGPGYYTWNTAGTANHQNVRFANIEGDHNNQSGAANYGCVTLSNLSYGMVSNYQCHDDGGTASSVSDAVLTDSNSDHITLNQGMAWNESTGGGTGQGIYDGGTPYLTVNGFMAFDNQATKTMGFCVNGTAGPGTVMTGLNCVPGSFNGPAFNLTLASDTDISASPGIPSTHNAPLTALRGGFNFVYGQGGTPTLASSATGSTPSLSAGASNVNGTMTATATAATTLTLTFALPLRTRTPDCTISPLGSISANIAGVNASVLLVNINSGNGGSVTYHCDGF